MLHSIVDSGIRLDRLGKWRNFSITLTGSPTKAQDGYYRNTLQEPYGYTLAVSVPSLLRASFRTTITNRCWYRRILSDLSKIWNCKSMPLGFKQSAMVSSVCERNISQGGVTWRTENQPSCVCLGLLTMLSIHLLWISYLPGTEVIFEFQLLENIPF